MELQNKQKKCNPHPKGGGHTNIQEATEKAMACNGCIQRPFAGGPAKLRISPTDGPECCKVIPTTGKQSSKAGWQPKAKDLTADDWEVIVKE